MQDTSDSDVILLLTNDKFDSHMSHFIEIFYKQRHILFLQTPDFNYLVLLAFHYTRFNVLLYIDIFVQPGMFITCNSVMVNPYRRIV